MARNRWMIAKNNDNKECRNDGNEINGTVRQSSSIVKLNFCTSLELRVGKGRRKHEDSGIFGTLEWALDPARMTDGSGWGPFDPIKWCITFPLALLTFYNPL